MILKYAVCAFALSFSLSSSTYAAIWPSNGHEYRVIAGQNITWTNARTAAKSLGPGWDLASIGSAEENTFVKSLLNSGLSERSHFWIGATDEASEGTWVWVDGTTWSFTDWWAGAPDDPGGEDRLAYDLRNGSWAWNDAPDDMSQQYPDYAKGYVAELSSVAPPSVAPASSPVPTLSVWGMIILSSLLALGTTFILRRQRS